MTGTLISIDDESIIEKTIQNDALVYKNVYTLSMSNSGIPTISVGGGGYTNTYRGRAVFTTYNNKFVLKNALFIRERGHLANSNEQAIVPIREGDIIVEYSGSYPITENNPDAIFKAMKVISITPETRKAHVEPIKMNWYDIHPKKLIYGLRSYHNREGNYFCNVKQKETY